MPWSSWGRGGRTETRVAHVGMMLAVALVACDGEPRFGNGFEGVRPSTGADAGAIGCFAPARGCPCAEGSAPVTCTIGQVVGDGTVTCGKGVRSCRKGTWTECETLGALFAASPVALVDGPAPRDLCDPDRLVARDRPTPDDLGGPNANGVVYDPDRGGIILEPQVVPSNPWTSVCGDGTVEDVEECDDGNTTSGDGCSYRCHLEPGWTCQAEGGPCRLTVCGDAIREGGEPCDDGNFEIGDGCTPFCQLEPSCTSGACSPVCGDGLLFAGEACDDGNRRNGDGCSSTCQVEEGFTCVAQPPTPPSFVDLPIVYRDFRTAHPDMDRAIFFRPIATGLVQSRWDNEKKPVRSNVVTDMIESADTFADWYRPRWWLGSRPLERSNITVPDRIRANRQPDGTYVFDRTNFFPLNTRGWSAHGAQTEPLQDGCPFSFVRHNYHFTSETRFWFRYQPGQRLEFRGDDDVWVFINGWLAVDLGGVHFAETGSVTLQGATATNLELVEGGLYEAAVFHAERQWCESNFRLTLGDFFFARSQCSSTCGDGIVTRNELCDDGMALNGTIGHCNSTCNGFIPGLPARGTYSRDYDAAAACTSDPNDPGVPVWGDLLFDVDTPPGTSIAFHVRAASRQTDLATATPLTFLVPPTASPIDLGTQLTGTRANAPYLRITAELLSASDRVTSPALRSFEVNFRCIKP